MTISESTIDGSGPAGRSPTPSADAPGILIAGHSHAYALGLPGGKPGSDPEVVEIASGFYGLIGSWPRTEAYWDALADRAREGGHTVALSFLGNEHLAHFLIEDIPFDFVSSDDQDTGVAKGVELVPESLLRAFFKEHSTTLPPILRKLEEAGVPTMVLGTPPPKEELEKRLAGEPFFLKRLEALGYCAETAKLSPAPLLLKLWRLLQRMLEEAAQGAGATFVPFPSQLMSGDGFLKPEYARADVTHANSAAGASFRSEIATLVGRTA